MNARMSPDRVARIARPLVPGVTLLLLVGLISGQRLHQNANAPMPTLKAGAPWLDKALPVSIGVWVSEPLHPAEAATPWFVRSRRVGRVYEHVDAGWRMTVEIVRSDPPPGPLYDASLYEYASAGWHILGERQWTWHFDETALSVVEYTLAASDRDRRTVRRLHPNGGELFLINLEPVVIGPPDRESDSADADERWHSKRAAVRLQVTFSGEMSRRDRRMAMETLMRALVFAPERNQGVGESP